MTQDEALTILKTGANVFLTGEPGSGKTHTVNAYVEWLRACGIEPAVTASTGIAATHIGGYTIHSWSGIGIKSDMNEEDLDRLGQNERLVRRARSTHVLIIDEISMLSSSTLSAVDAACQALRGSHAPFGGMQIVLVGDFFQLPPIVRRDEWSDRGERFFSEEEENRSHFAFSSRSWRALDLIVCYLSEQHRQEDSTFLEILSAIRQGRSTESHRKTLLSRRTVLNAESLTALFPHNIDVDRVNATALSKLPGKTHEFWIERTGPDALTAQLIRGCLSPETLALKEGARVMFTKNNFPEEFVNGTTGTVVGFDAGTNGYPIVEIAGGRHIIAEPMEWAIEGNGRALARIIQVPLRLAWAITVHKSQGMSLDAAHMDLSSAFEYGQGYVALSRVRTLAGLSLVALNDRALSVHPEIAKEDLELRERAEAAREAFSALDARELKSMRDNFVKSCGGKEPSEVKTKDKKVARPDSKSGGARKEQLWKQTFELVAQGMSLERAAEERGRKVETLLSHLEELATLGRLERDKIAHISRGIEYSVERAIEAFKVSDTVYLKPIFDSLNGEVSYPTIRIARLLGGFSIPSPKSGE